MDSRLLAVAVLAAVLVPLPLLATPAERQSEAVERYMEHVRFLASPEMRGRGPGMPELDEAADYIAGRFRELGLQPAGDDGSFLQPFEVTTGANMGKGNSMRVERPRGVSELEVSKDFIPINFSASGEVEGEVVFAGYGASAEELGYDDYFHFDVTDKIVLVLRYEPDFFREEDDGEGDRGDSERGRRYTRHAHLIAKAIQARNRGARAVLVVDGRTRGRSRDRLIRFGSVSGPTDAGIPMVQVRREVAERWLRGSGRSLRLLRRDIEESRRPQTFNLASSLRIRLSVDVEHERATVSNVAAYLPGSTPDYVVLGAHYDHLGLGGENSLSPSSVGKVHPGADDNASGVAAILEFARTRSARGEEPRHGLLFLAFAAEEIGLLGSGHWVDNPTLPLENAVAMLNFDMVGRIQNRKLYVGGVGTAGPFADLVEQAASEHELKVDKSRSASSSSDHTSFSAKKIPVLFFFSGLHSDYHKPGDTPDKINGEAAVDLLGVADRIVHGIEALDDRLAFVDKAPESGHGRPSGDGASSGGYGPWFGSIPDFGEVPSGVKFADVRTGSPAALAGLRGGDILTHWNDAPITNLYDFTYALRDSEVGEVVRVRVLRDGEEVRSEVTLAERP
ncbi:MAG: M20/M25/M40 family metallo-hydrolase [Bryobacterales bacterium]|nr:M20/M25/M40 family metallo-hydrolase [Bryobacterales bacterium]